VGDLHRDGAVLEMEACWPSGVGLRGQALNRPGAALAEDRRGVVNMSAGGRTDCWMVVPLTAVL
jgi:hypothetical protein